jgi:hypothetical protein
VRENEKRYRVVAAGKPVAIVAVSSKRLPKEQDLRDLYRISPFVPIWLEEIVPPRPSERRHETGRGERSRSTRGGGRR